ncbi:MAG: ribbon-helix-helix protein, CopG family [Candidatus Latescibacterota bacterium]
MPNDAALHLRLDPAMAETLKRIARKRQKSPGQLVREAIAACYQTEGLQLPTRQEQALAAYQGGFISLGKLARVMGLHVLELRLWLDEHGIPQSIAYCDSEAESA